MKSRAPYHLLLAVTGQTAVALVVEASLVVAEEASAEEASAERAKIKA